MKKSLRKRIWTILIAIISVLLILNLGATLYFYQIACVRNNQPIGQVKTSSPNYSLVQKFNKLPKSTETLTNNDLKLDAWYVPAEQKTNNTVIVVHGFRQDKSAM